MRLCLSLPQQEARRGLLSAQQAKFSGPSPFLDGWLQNHTGPFELFFPSKRVSVHTSSVAHVILSLLPTALSLAETEP